MIYNLLLIPNVKIRYKLEMSIIPDNNKINKVDLVCNQIVAMIHNVNQ